MKKLYLALTCALITAFSLATSSMAMEAPRSNLYLFAPGGTTNPALQVIMHSNNILIVTTEKNFRPFILVENNGGLGTTTVFLGCAVASWSPHFDLQKANLVPDGSFTPNMITAYIGTDDLAASNWLATINWTGGSASKFSFLVAPSIENTASAADNSA